MRHRGDSPSRARFSICCLLALVAGLIGSVSAQAQHEPKAGAAVGTKVGLEQAVKIGLDRQPNVIGARASRDAAIASQEAAQSPLGVLSGPIIHVRRKQAQLGVAIAQSGLEQAELETINAVTRTYVTYLYASEQLGVATNAIDVLETVHKFAEKGVKDGTLKDVTQADVDRINVYMNLARSKQFEAQAGKERAKAALREAMGLPQGTPLEIADETLSFNPVKISCEKAVAAALKHRPEVIQAALAAEVALLEIEAQGLSIHAYSKTFAATGDIHAKVLPATVSNGDYRPGALGPEMPPYLAGSYKARKERASHLATRAEAVADKTRGLVSLEVEEACQRVQEQGRQIDLLKKASVTATKQARDAEKAFRGDLIKADQMLLAQALELQAKAALNEALYRYNVALATLHRATGGRFWESVEK